LDDAARQDPVSCLETVKEAYCGQAEGKELPGPPGLTSRVIAT